MPVIMCIIIMYETICMLLCGAVVSSMHSKILLFKVIRTLDFDEKM